MHRTFFEGTNAHLSVFIVQVIYQMFTTKNENLQFSLYNCDLVIEMYITATPDILARSD